MKLNCEVRSSRSGSCFCSPILSLSTQSKPTLMMIFSFSWVGDGSWSALASTGFIKSWSPNTSLNTLAMCRCCSTLQCSSMDRMTGYLWWTKPRWMKTISFCYSWQGKEDNTLPQPPDERKYLKETRRQKEDVDTTNNNRCAMTELARSEGTCEGPSNPNSFFGKANS